jgi:transcriptional pleiotropic regulator of transition state genes
MKATGVTRSLDNLGRIVIPKELRRTLNLNEGDALEIFTENETVILRKYNPGCSFCGEMTGIKDVKGIKICPKCIEAIKKL